MADVEDIVEEVTEGVLSMGKRKLFGIAGILSGGFGFVSDVLQPIAPFAIYLFIGSAVLLVFSLVYYLKTKRGLVSAVVLLCMAGVLGVVTIIQQVTDSTKAGVASKVVPGISDLQRSLGMISDTVTDIKKDTVTIKKNVEEIKNVGEKSLESAKQVEKHTGALVNSAKQINEKADKISGDAEKTHQALTALGKKIDGKDGGGIKQNPTTPEDCYHNAKLYELRGDYGNARRSYKAYIAFDTGKLEPHLRLTDFLRANEGRAGAREEYTLIVRGNDSLEATYAKLLLLNPEGRKVALEVFQKKQPNYAPVYYHLSREFSLDVLGQQSFSDKRKELKYLSSFKRLDEQGHLAKYFIDKERLLMWRDDVRSRLKMAEAFQHQIENPVTVEWMSNNIGVTGVLKMLDPVLDIEVRQQGVDKFKNLGHGDIDSKTGNPTPISSISLAEHELTPKTFEVRFRHVNGEWSEVFLVSLEQKHIDGFQKEIERVVVDPRAKKVTLSVSKGWCNFREYDGHSLFYFTNLRVYRKIIKEVRYGIAKEQPDLIFNLYADKGEKPKLPDVPDKKEILEHNKELGVMNGLLYFPLGTPYATVQVTFLDNTKSEIIKFVNPAVP